MALYTQETESCPNTLGLSISFLSLRPLRLGGTLREAEASTLKN
jgi:hypothetical protein